jgi:hypothetical protein
MEVIDAEILHEIQNIYIFIFLKRKIRECSKWNYIIHLNRKWVYFHQQLKQTEDITKW